jgi:TolB-like protein
MTNADFNEAVGDDIQAQLRIGLSLGEVVIADNTVTGAGVVLAQRLEQLAVSGGVVVQGAVSEAVPTRLPFDYENLGEQILKGFDQPIRALLVSLKPGELLPAPSQADIPGTEGIGSREPALTPPDRPSIAVIPFATSGTGDELGMFADGLAEDVITGLSRLRELFVIDRNSTFAYKEGAGDTTEVGRDLGVRYVLEGSVRGAAGRMRIAVRLVETNTLEPVWAETYDRVVDDPFETQDELRRNIVSSLQTQLVLREGAGASPDSTGASSDTVLLRRAARLLYELSDANVAEALTIARSALKHEPENPAALRILASCLYHKGVLGFEPERQELLERALDAARRSAVLDERHELTHWLIGNLELWAHRRHEQAVAAFERCLELNPNYSLGFASLGNTLIFAGEADRGIEHIDLALRCNPRDPYNFFRHQALALGYLLTDRLEEALVWSSRAMHRRPDYYLGQVVHTAILAALRRDADARVTWALAKASLARPEHGDLGWLPFKRAADRERLEAALAGLS